MRPINFYITTSALIAFSISACSEPQISSRSANDVEKSCLSLVGASKTSLYNYTGIIGAQNGQSIVTCSATFVGHNVMLTAGHCISRANPGSVRYLGNSEMKTSEVSKRFREGIQAKSVIHHGSNYIGTEMNLSLESIRTRDFAVIIFPDNTAPDIVAIASSRPTPNSTIRITSYGNYTFNVTSTQDKFRWTGTNILEDFKSRGSSMPAITAPPTTNNPADVLAAPGDSGGGVFVNDKLFAVVSAGGNLTNIQAFNLFTDVNLDANKQLIQRAVNAGAKIGVPSQVQVTPPTPAPTPPPPSAPTPPPSPQAGNEQLDPAPSGNTDDSDMPELHVDNPTLPSSPIEVDADEPESEVEDFEVTAKKSKSKAAIEDEDDCEAPVKKRRDKK